MTTHVHEASGEGSAASDSGSAVATDRSASAFEVPRWLLPALSLGVVVIGLVVAGVLSFSTVLFVAGFGGMLLMHTGGHGGHGGHDGHGGSPDAGSTGHAGHSQAGIGGDGPEAPGSQPPGTGTAIEGQASNDPGRAETKDDGHDAHTC